MLRLIGIGKLLRIRLFGNLRLTVSGILKGNIMIVQIMKKFGLGFAAAALLVNQAFAAVPLAVSGGISTASADATAVGEAILGVMIAIAVIMWIRKILH